MPTAPFTNSQPTGAPEQEPQPVPTHTQNAQGENVIQTGNLTAQGDIHISMEYLRSAQVSEVKLTGYSEPNYFPPTFSDHLLQMVKESRMVILHGNPGFQKQALIRFLAAQLHHQFANHKVLEVDFRSGDLESLPGLLSHQDSPAILLIDDLLPLDLQGRPHAVGRLAERGDHFILAITDSSPLNWHFSSAEQRCYWYSVGTERLYQREVLTRCLQHEMAEMNAHIKWAPGMEWQTENTPSSLDLAHTATELSTPERIAFFVHLLSIEQGEVDQKKFEKILSTIIASRDSLLQTWFHAADDKNRMILIATALFNGLFEEQFFRLSDAVIEQRWRHRVPELEALDFCDLDAVHHFTGFDQTDQHGLVLRSKFDLLDLDVIHLSKRGYRRHILAALPVIKTAIEASVGKSNKTYPRRLRDHLSLTISHLAIHFPDSTLPILEEFAQSTKAPLQRVAARAISNWRSTGEWERLENTLDQWLKVRGSAGAERRRQTALMVISYAADYDQHNQLNAKIVSWLEQLYRDGSDKVHDFLGSLLPKMVRNHPKQLAPLLRDELLRARDQIRPVAQGLAMAIDYYPQEAKAVIENWLQEAEQKATGTGHKLTHRDRILLSAIWALILADPVNRQKAFPQLQLLDFLVDLRKQESQAVVRKELFEAIFECLKLTEAVTAVQIQNLLESSEDPSEKLLMIEALAKVFSGSEALPNLTFKLPEFVVELSENEKKVQVRRALTLLALSLRAKDETNLLERLYQNCQFVEERMEILKLIQAQLSALMQTNDEQEAPPETVDLQALLQTLIDFHSREFHNTIRKELAKPIVTILNHTQNLAPAVLIQFMESCDYKEQVPLLEIYTQMLIEGRIDSPEKSLPIVAKMLQSNNIYARKEIFDLVSPSTVALADKHPEFSFTALKLFAMHTNFYGRAQSGKLVGEIYQQTPLQRSEEEVLIDQFKVPNQKRFTEVEERLFKLLQSEHWRLRQFATLSFLEIAHLQRLAENAPAAPAPTIDQGVTREEVTTILGNFRESLPPQLERLPSGNRRRRGNYQVTIPDPKYMRRLSWFALLVGFLVSVFQASDTRRQFWLTIRTVLSSSDYGMATVRAMARKWATSNDVHARSQGALMRKFFRWVHKSETPS